MTTQPLFVRIVDAIAFACALAAAALFVTATLVVSWMVFHRALGNSSYWEIEFAIYVMVAAIFLGSPYCLRTGGHVAIDLVSEHLSGRAARAYALLVSLLGMAVCLWLAWYGAQLFWKAWVTNETTGSLWRPPTWPLYLSMPVGLALTALQYAAEIARPRAAP
jgi:TRAP-type C4-dicarboxylate transport system permease small subunit